MKNRFALLIYLFALAAAPLALSADEHAAAEPVDERMQWFVDAKFGVFIHWGIYAVLEKGESWPLFNLKVDREDYFNQVHDFTAENYDPQEWATLFKDAGAKYVVLTTKHHDGVALWDTQANDLSVVKKTPTGRDLILPYAEALREQDLKVGFYYSWLDWANEDYLTQGWRDKKQRDEHGRTPRPELMDPAAWERFQTFYNQQLDELLVMEPDLMWFDGQWEVKEEFWGFGEINEKIRTRLPEIILNGRITGFADYDTPEQVVPIRKLDGPWELCMTMNPGGWGFRSDLTEAQKHSSSHLIRLLAECSHLGGNLLLNVAPKPDGTIPDWQQERLRDIGAWLDLNGEAVYGSVAGINREHYAQGSTLSKDGKTLYLFVFSRPENDIMLKGLLSKPSRISILGAEDAEFETRRIGGRPHKKLAPTRFISFPENVEIGHGRVVKLEFKEPIVLTTSH